MLNDEITNIKKLMEEQKNLNDHNLRNKNIEIDALNSKILENNNNHERKMHEKQHVHEHCI